MMQLAANAHLFSSGNPSLVAAVLDDEPWTFSADVKTNQKLNFNLPPNFHNSFPFSRLHDGLSLKAELSHLVLETTKEYAYRRQYPIPEALKPLADAAVKKWLEQGRIEEDNTNSGFNSPLGATFRRNAQGEKDWTRPRWYFDYRHVNEALDKGKCLVNTELPTLEETFRQVQGFTFFTAIDLTGQGKKQVRL